MKRFTNYSKAKTAGGPVNSMRMLDKNRVWDILAHCNFTDSEVRVASLADLDPIEAEEVSSLFVAAKDLLDALEQARIALDFYAVWMTDHCPEGNGSTSYPFGQHAAKAARAAIAKAKGETAKT